ncbi:MAG: YfiR family protein [Sedimentisphaerales bacterium]|nr:YfiR family protein [Sedimentisphaerales bacterium]
MKRSEVMKNRIKTYIFAAVLLALFIGPQVQANSDTAREYQVKAAFLYNFIMFVDWPASKMPNDSSPVLIGIVGKDPFGDAFDPVKDKQAKNKKVVIKRFKGLEELKKATQEEKDAEFTEIKKCHMVFICGSEEKVVKETIDMIKGSDILTVGDTSKFLSDGGIINFVIEDKKVRFEVNLGAAKQANLKIRSQLLRLAIKVIE